MKLCLFRPSRRPKINILRRCTSLQMWNHILHFQIYVRIKSAERWNVLKHSRPDPLRGHPSRRWATSSYQRIQTSNQRYRSICPRDVWASHASTPPHQHSITSVVVWSDIDPSVRPVMIHGAGMFAWEHVMLLNRSQYGYLSTFQWHGSQLHMYCFKGNMLPGCLIHW